MLKKRNKKTAQKQLNLIYNYDIKQQKNRKNDDIY